MINNQSRKFAAEAFGTSRWFFAGTGAVVANHVSGGTVTHVGIALTFGLIVLAMIYALGDVSGCHLNPAVTFGFYIARRFDRNLIVPYILSQCVGAIAASLMLRMMFWSSETLGATQPSGGTFSRL